MSDWCPECGCSMSGPLMFGEMVCDDPDCGYWMYAEEENTTTQGEK